MKEYIAFDSHKHYTLVEREVVETGKTRQCRIEHGRGAIRDYLKRRCEVGTDVAVEATGNWYWIVDEIEQAGMRPRLVHPRKAKLMMGMINKTDKLDVHGLNRLQRNGTLPTVWIPPGELRDLRELTRTRTVLVRERTRLKNRIHATLAKYGLSVKEADDIYAKKARKELEACIKTLPPETAFAAEMLLADVDHWGGGIAACEKRIGMLVEVTAEMQLLMTVPGIGVILAAVISLELGDVKRFASAERMASYAGTTPRVHASGDKVRYGRLRPDVNRYLRWAFIEAASSISRHRGSWPDRHVSRLYTRIRERRGHSTAVGAVARHLAEACFHVLTRKEPYRDPALMCGQAREA